MHCRHVNTGTVEIVKRGLKVVNPLNEPHVINVGQGRVIPGTRPDSVGHQPSPMNLHSSSRTLQNQASGKRHTKRRHSLYPAHARRHADTQTLG